MLKRSGSGFTIVELLVVIVVIGILAAITIVSYNGIVDRAKNTQLLSTVDAYTKAFQIYKAQNGTYPAIVAGETGNSVASCLGKASDYPTNSTFTDPGTCGIQSSTVYKVSPTLMNQLGQMTSGLPAGVLPTMVLTSTGTYRGLLYTVAGPNTVYIVYVVDGNQDCARGVKTYDSTQNATICRVDLN